MTTLLAYHGDAALKERTLDQLRQHRAADEIVQRVYWEKTNGSFHGCAVGCLTHDPEGGHEQFPDLWGIPEVLAHLIDSIFERLPTMAAKDWPLRVMDAIPVGADLTLVWPRFARWVLTDHLATVGKGNPEWGVQAAIDGVVTLFDEQLVGREPDEAAWAARAAGAAGAAEAAEAQADKFAELCAAAPIPVGTRP